MPIRRAGAQVIDARVNGDLALSRALGDFRHKAVPNLAPYVAAYTLSSMSCLPLVAAICYLSSDSAIPQYTTFTAMASSHRCDYAQVIGVTPLPCHNRMHRSHQPVSSVADVCTTRRIINSDGFLLIACDGVWDVLSSEDAVR